jgi:hypothetical protein
VGHCAGQCALGSIYMQGDNWGSLSSNLVVVVRAVTEVEASNRHPGTQQLLQHLGGNANRVINVIPTLCLDKVGRRSLNSPLKPPRSPALSWTWAPGCRQPAGERSIGLCRAFCISCSTHPSQHKSLCKPTPLSCRWWLVCQPAQLLNRGAPSLIGSFCLKLCTPSAH